MLAWFTRNGLACFSATVAANRHHDTFVYLGAEYLSRRSLHEVNDAPSCQNIHILASKCNVRRRKARDVALWFSLERWPIQSFRFSIGSSSMHMMRLGLHTHVKNNMCMSSCMYVLRISLLRRIWHHIKMQLSRLGGPKRASDFVRFIALGLQ